MNDKSYKIRLGTCIKKVNLTPISGYSIQCALLFLAFMFEVVRTVDARQSYRPLANVLNTGLRARPILEIALNINW